MYYTPVFTNIPMKNGPFEDAFSIENGDVPASYVSLPEGIFSADEQGVSNHLLSIRSI